MKNGSYFFIVDCMRVAMKNMKISILLLLGAFALFACSDDSSSGVSATEEASSDSQVVESSSEEADHPASSSVAEKEKSSSSAVPESSSSEKTPESSSQDTEPASSAKGDDPVPPETKFLDWRDTCLDIINEYRATENLGPLSRASDEKQACTDKQAADDLASESPHGHFLACGEGAQNSGPNVSMYASKSYSDYVRMYLKMMWEDEKALVVSGEADPDNDDDYPKIGHYLNMKGKFKTVACGFAVSSDGKKGWLNINFFR